MAKEEPNEGKYDEWALAQDEPLDGVNDKWAENGENFYSEEE